MKLFQVNLQENTIEKIRVLAKANKKTHQEIIEMLLDTYHSKLTLVSNFKLDDVAKENVPTPATDDAETNQGKKTPPTLDLGYHWWQ